MSYLGVLNHDASHRLFIYVLWLVGAVFILSCAAYADPEALPGINLHSQPVLNEGDIEALGASGVALVFENTQVTQQSTVTATLYGHPHSDYYVWFMDTKKMTGQYGDQPPQFSKDQETTSNDPQNGPYIIGSYVYSKGGGTSIQENVAGLPSHGVLYYAQVRTGSNGQATITFVMSRGTKPGLYTVRAERFAQGQYEIADVSIEVFEKQDGMMLTTEKKSVSLGEDIVLTFTGQPLKYYMLWVVNTGSMSGGAEDQPPLLMSEQENVWRDPASGPYEIGQYRCDTCRGLTLQQSVSNQPDSGTRYYARVMTDNHGFGTVTFSSTNLIKPQDYTFRIEEPFSAVGNSAEVTVQIQSSSSPTPSFSLSLNQASVIQGEQFYAEIWGTPKTQYYLWFFNTNTMDGTFGHQPPSIAKAQTLVSHDPVLGPYSIGNYQYDGGGGDTLLSNIAIDSEYKGTYYYGLIETDTSGYGRVVFYTDAGTESKTYTLRAERARLVDGAWGEMFTEAQVMVKTSIDSVTITPESEHIALGSSSFCIITGLPNTVYYLWFYNTDYMSGYPGDQPPTFQENQKQFLQDPASGPYTIGGYAYADACCGRVIKNDIPSRPDSGVRYYGLVQTDEMGRAVIGFDTEYMVTKPGNYQIRAEKNTGSGYQSATAIVTIGSNLLPTPVPTLWPTSTQTYTPDPTWKPVPTQTYTPPGKLMLATDTSVLNSGETATVTLSGQPLTEYYVWVSGTAHLSGSYGDQPPIIPPQQRGIYQDRAQNIIIGKHLIEGKDGMTIHHDVPLYPDNGTCYYALVTTDQMGIAQMKLQAPQGVRPQEYTLRAERTELLTHPEIATTFVTVPGVPSPELALTVQPSVSSFGTVFQAHVSGTPLTTYYLWISKTSEMSGMPGAQPPLIQPQLGIVQDGVKGPFFIGDYFYLGGNKKSIRSDVPIQPESGVRYYAQVMTNEQGQATFSLTTSSDTRPGEYTLTAELPLIRGAGEKNSAENFELERYTSRTTTAQFSVHSAVQDQFSLQLLPGWNFISIPGVPAPGSDTLSVFSGVDTQGRSIWAYDPGKWPQTQGWNMGTMYDKIEPLHGYWIYTVSPMTVLIPISDHIRVNAEPFISPYAKQMYLGWNAIGFFGQYPRSAKDALVSIDNDWTVALGYDNALQRYDTSIIHGGDDDYADTRFLQPGAGYWIYMQNPGTLF
ncbi:MAG: Ig-like domain-containing protein [Methanomicrobiales archaeon]|jgi:hypothetical protein|nr:Ig-like domain-containing protein [Methanomicrobiales archaeon]